MGAWGSGHFENDDALDWLSDFCNEPDRELIRDALSTVADMDVDEYLEAPDCSVCLAAAEVVAALKGVPNPDMPDEAKDCVSNLDIGADPSLIDLALRAIAKIKTNSELKELWDESENPDQWYAAVNNLETRLGQ